MLGNQRNIFLGGIWKFWSRILENLFLKFLEHIFNFVLNNRICQLFYCSFTRFLVKEAWLETLVFKTKWSVSTSDSVFQGIFKVSSLCLQSVYCVATKLFLSFSFLIDKQNESAFSKFINPYLWHKSYAQVHFPQIPPSSST